MDLVRQPILRIPKNVIEDMRAYRGQVEKFLNGEITPAFFRTYRVPMGIYEQRTAGRYMVRIRIGAGLVLPHQLYRIADLSKKYGNSIIHITTRQDIQIHDVDIKDTPDVLESLLEVGLSSRGGGGNTVRNITACPRLGVCARENFDVAPYAIALAEYLLQDNSSFNLPRKFKIAFSGCSDDCAYASITDLGFFAHIKDGVKGFAVYAGGGLGSNPLVATKLDEFIKEEEIFETAEAVKQLFDKYGDRLNKHKARLRYVLAKTGPEEFVKLYKSELAEIRKVGLQGNIPQIRNVIPQEIKDLSSITVRLTHGDIPADDLIKVAKIAEKFGQGPVRTSQRQDIIITGVAGRNFEKTLNELRRIKAVSIDKSGTKIVVCTGAATCKLGLCLSKNLANAIAAELEKKNISVKDKDFIIKISGCPNSCGSHHIAPIGFEGMAKRVNDKLMPFYNVLAGAVLHEGSTRLAERVGVVPAKRVPQLVAELLADGHFDLTRIKDLTARYGEIPSDVPDDYFCDFGQTAPFTLAGRGPGECGAGVTDLIKLDIDQAKEAIRKAKETLTDKNDNIYKGIVASARALLVVFGLEPKKDREIFSAFAEHLIKPGWVKNRTQQMFDDVLDWRVGDKPSIENLLPETLELIARVEALFLSLDSQLKFKIEPLKSAGNAVTETTGIHSIDLRGVTCPLNFVKAKLKLEKINVGETLEIMLDEGEPAANVPASFTEQGQEVIEITNEGGYFRVTVRRKK